MSELDNILARLIQRTTERKLKWSRAANPNQFVTSVDAISVVIHEMPGFDYGVSSSYRLEILNEDGETVEILGDMEATVEQCQQLERLHTTARRSTLRYEETLEKLARALDV